MDKCLEFLSIIMKPTNNCNLRCKYCYHSERGYSEQIMEDDLLEKVFSITLPYYKKVSFIWHGGEPLLLPLNFYDRALAYQNKYRNSDSQEVTNSIQTNGTLINDEITRYIKENKIGIGLSFDGPLNERMRGLTNKTLDGFKTLQEHGVKTGAIAVIGSHNINKLLDTYDYFRELGMNVKLNTIFNSGTAKESDFLISDEENYVEKMCDLFDIWLTDVDCNIDVMPFSEYISTVLFNSGKECIHTSCIYAWLGIDYKGDIYPCGRSYPENYKLGNLLEFDDIRQVFLTDAYNEIIRKSKIRIENCRSTCDMFKVCQGGCNNDAILHGDLEKIPEPSCRTYRKMLLHVRNRMNMVRKEIFEDGNVRVNKYVLRALLKNTKKVKVS